MARKTERKNGKQRVYENHAEGCIVLVKSCDPKTEIKILKDAKKKGTAKRQKSKQISKECGYGLMSSPFWDGI